MKITLKIARGLLSKVLVFLVLCACALPFESLIAQVQPRSQAPQKRQASQELVAGTAVDGPGERKFHANCSRCHTAPEQISPRITGTILRHMRVRASLSAEDEQDILHYLAP